MFSSSTLALALLPFALAAPRPAAQADPVHIPILRRSITAQDRVANLPYAIDSLRLKYGFKPVNQKRSTGSTAISDEENDSSYSAVVDIGTPAQEFNLILDTGSSDLWVATRGCYTCTSDIPLFNPSQSTTFTNSSNSLQITYGSGAVSGYAAQDAVAFSGFNISSQALLATTETSSGLLSDTLSGIMGLGFRPLSALQATPLWESLYNQNSLSSPVFSFHLDRYVDASQTIDVAPGGTFTLGGTNTSLYSGNVEFINMPSGTTPSYWLQQVQSVTVQGRSISVSSSDGLAAIDTGTTLIGAPSDIAREVWSNVPGSEALAGQYQGMYAFPCSTSVSVSLSFGGTEWAIDTADMNLGAVSGSGLIQMCIGGIFDVGTSSGDNQGVPSWIVGDTFLKNVYTVFRANPPAVGFARLASGLSSSGGNSPGSVTFSGSAGIPVPTGGSGSGGSGSSGSGSSGVGTSAASPRTVLSISLVFVLSFCAGIFLVL